MMVSELDFRKGIRTDGAYRGYEQRLGTTENRDEALELLLTGPGTPMNEYMRRHWQPVCLSEQLTDVPKAIRILHEDLVAFRDRSGDVGVLQRRCSHRGSSLEFGIVQEHGIRCCYHGWLYDVDGTILETPCEASGNRLQQTICQPAYPAFERDGLVFAYMGPPDAIPPFDLLDAYVLPEGTRLVAFSNEFACNWLQVYENLIDHYHTAILHNNMTVEGVDAALAAGASFGGGWGELPIINWQPVHDGHGMVFTAGRRVSDTKVWIRISEMGFPNFCTNAALAPSAARQRHSNVAMTRWQVPVDDTNSIAFGWRHFNDEVDPDHLGREEDCGVDKIDFLIGQTRHRSYDEQQRVPGDYEAITSQGAGGVAIHQLEHPGRSDVGVYMCRSLLRDALRGKTGPDPTGLLSKAGGDSLARYTSDTVVEVRKLADRDADRALIQERADQVLAVMKESETVASAERRKHVLYRLDEIDGGLGPFDD
jgi:phenylpropionate dioxygenase-like ring-hydroxylating dioxygenase large terminal subunit